MRLPVNTAPEMIQAAIIPAGWSSVMMLPTNTRVHLAVGKTDMRKGIGLPALSGPPSVSGLAVSV